MSMDFILRGDGRERTLGNNDDFGPKKIGLHTSTSGRIYELQYDPEGKLAQAVFLPPGGGAGQLVLAFRAESRKEALETLIEELDNGSH
jgi:hypothetical protein